MGTGILHQIRVLKAPGISRGHALSNGSTTGSSQSEITSILEIVLDMLVVISGFLQVCTNTYE